MAAEPCSAALKRPPPPPLLPPLLGVPTLPPAANVGVVVLSLLLLLPGPESWRLVAVLARDDWLTGELRGSLRPLLADGGAEPFPFPLPLFRAIVEESNFRKEARGFKPGGGAAVLG